MILVSAQVRSSVGKIRDVSADEPNDRFPGVTRDMLQPDVPRFVSCVIM